MCSLRSKHFHGVLEQRKTEEWDFRFFAKHRKSRFFDFLCSPTPRKRLLRRLESMLIFQQKFNAKPPLQSTIKYIRQVISTIMWNFIIRFALAIWFYGMPPRQKSKGNRFSGYSDCWQDEQNNTQVLMILESPNRHFVVFGKTNYCFLSIRFQQNIYFYSVVWRNADHPCMKIISLISSLKIIYTNMNNVDWQKTRIVLNSKNIVI